MTKSHRRPRSSRRPQSRRLASTMPRPVAVSRSRKQPGGWLKRLTLLTILTACLGWVISVGWFARQRFRPDQVAPSHAFIVSQTNPTLLIVSQGAAPATLSGLQVFRPDQSDSHPVVLNLPLDIADTQTSAGQYAESGYHRELQQLVEQTLAVPLTGYLYLPRTSGGEIITVQWLKHQSSLWNLTVGLPWTLHNLPAISTNLTPESLYRLAWYIHGLSDSQLAPLDLPSNSLSNQAGRVQVNTATSDPFIAQHFALSSIKAQNTSVVIKNATTTPGLASTMARFITNMGGEVVAAEAADQQNTTQTTMVSDRPTALSQEISSFLGVNLDQQPGTGRERADIELVLGSDVLSRLEQ